MPGFERWWDGGTWSHVTRPAPGAAQQPAYSPPLPFLPQGTAQPQVPAQPQAPESQLPYPGSPYPGSSYPGSPYPGSSYPGSPYPGSTYQGAPGYAIGPPSPSTADGAVLASRWARLGANIIDGLICAPIAALIGYQQLLAIVRPYQSWFQQVITSSSNGGVTPQPTFVSDPQFATALTVYSVISITVFVIYATVLIALRGATVGKMAVGIRVRRVAAEGLVGWGTALLRAVSTQVPRLVPFAGGFWQVIDDIWCLWDPQRQCLHDKLARTVVVKRRDQFNRR
jgi:uncharacterized RDD family membrane protein YckC